MSCRNDDNQVLSGSFDDAEVDHAIRYYPRTGTPAQRVAELLARASVARFGGLPLAATWCEVVSISAPVLDRESARAACPSILAADRAFMLSFEQRLSPHTAWLLGGGQRRDGVARVLCRDLDRLLEGAIGTAVTMRFGFVALCYSGFQLLGPAGDEYLGPAERSLAEAIRRAGGDETAWPHGFRRSFVLRLYDCRDADDPGKRGPAGTWYCKDDGGEPVGVPDELVGDFQHVTVDEHGATVPPGDATAGGEA